MNRKQVLRMGVDLVITLSLLLLMAYELVGQAAHEWIGTAMVLLLIVHHILNRRWLAAIPQGRYTPYRVLQTTLVALILAAMAVQAVSGVILSRHLYTFLPIQGHTRIARTLHMLGAYWGFVLMSLHLGIHWSMMLGAVGKLVGPPVKRRTVILRLLAAAVSVWGACAFFRRQIGAYMTMQMQFAFFDFQEPGIFFFADYLAVMVLFVCLGHCLAQAVKKFGQKRGGTV